MLWLHRIIENRFSQTATRISMMLKNLCGDAAMNQLMLCTTMWDKVDVEEGSARLDELYENSAWKEMMSKGASTAAISNVKSDAKLKSERIVGQLIKNAQPIQIVIKKELANEIRNMKEATVAPSFGEHSRESQGATSEAEELHVTLHEESAAREAKAQEALDVQLRDVEKLTAQADEEPQAAKRELEKICVGLHEETEAIEAKAQEAHEAIRVRELETERPTAQAEEESQAAKREVEELHVSMHEESKAGEAKAQEAHEAIRVQELEVERLKSQAEEQARALQTQTEHFLLERQQPKREMKALREKMRKTGQPIAAKVREERRAREGEVALSTQRTEAPNPAEQSDPEHYQHRDETADGEINRLRELAHQHREEKRARQRVARERSKRQSEQAQTQKNRVKQLQQELKKAESVMKELQARMAREETSAVNEITFAALASKLAQGLLWFVNW